jgi:hypothetical protein
MKNHIKTVLEYLFVKVTSWVPTNWRVRITKYKENHLEEFLVYESQCWKCGTPINAEKLFYFYGVFVTAQWEGALKCRRAGCGYFICKRCGKCLHDSPTYDPTGLSRPRATLWVRLNERRFKNTNRLVYEYGVQDIYLDRLQSMKRSARQYFRKYLQ